MFLRGLTVGDLPISFGDIGIPLYQARGNLLEAKDLEI